MTESDYNTIRLVQNLPTATVSNPPKGNEEKRKRRNVPKGIQEQADVVEDKPNESAPESIRKSPLEKDTDELHMDYRV